MIIEQRIALSAPVERVWDRLMDIPAVARCVPGTESVTALGDGTYAGVLRVSVGPIGARLEGRLAFAERDQTAWRARMDVKADDRRIASAVSAKMTMQLEPADAGCVLAVHTDAAILGKLGQFGQAIIRRKADDIMAEFARNLAREIAEGA